MPPKSCAIVHIKTTFAVIRRRGRLSIVLIILDRQYGAVVWLDRRQLRNVLGKLRRLGIARVAG